ncbi:Codanin-1, partial [Stegodyphus mimosarum]
MADILKDVVTGKICLNDFIEWLKYDKSDIEKLRLVGNSEFIPFFLNYVKDKCSQVLKSSKDDSIAIQKIVNNRFPDTTSIVNKDHEKGNVNYQSPKFREFGVRARNNEKIYNTDGIKTKSTSVYQNGYSQPKSMAVHQNGYSQAKSTIIHQNGYSQAKSTTVHQNGYSHVKSMTSYHDTFHQSKNFHQVSQNLNLGCAPYLHKQKDFKNSFHKTKTNPEVPDVNSVETFPPVGGKIDQTKARRRITPTPIQASDNSSLRFGNSCFSVPMEKVQSDAFKMMPLQEQSYSTLQEERDMLKYTRSVMSKPPGVSSNAVVEKSVKKSVMQPVSIEYIVPNPENIYFQEQILIIAEIYGFLMSNALVSNITSELYFLFELVTARVSTEGKPSQDDILSSVHNCVYFAVSILSKHCYLLQVLDNATLSSLCEIPYLFIFSPQLVNFLQFYLDASEFTHSLAKQEAVSSLNSVNSVAFQAEEDSRSNFINDDTFVSFRKQRDLFYELLQEWQQKSMEYVDSKFCEKFSRKTKLLVNLGPNTVNLYHLAKLFYSQLIASCLYLEVSEVKDELLRDIQRNFPG